MHGNFLLRWVSGLHVGFGLLGLNFVSPCLWLDLRQCNDGEGGDCSLGCAQIAARARNDGAGKRIELTD